MHQSEYQPGRSWRVSRVFLLALILTSCTAAYRDPHARTPGNVADDVAIGTKLKSKLLADKQTSGLRINVDVHQGVVLLKGRVASAAAASRAQDLAQAIKGVTQVDNRLSYPAP